MNQIIPQGSISQTETPFIGLAPFLRQSIAGEDIQATGQGLLERIQDSPDDANLWMNLSTAMLCLGQSQLGLSIQSEALAMKTVYFLAAAEQPARLTVLLLMAPGDLAANTPLDCLLEDSDIDLIFYYLKADDPEGPFAAPLPEHDILLVAISETDENRELLAYLEKCLVDWPVPVINAPQHIPSVGRNVACNLLTGAPGLAIPPSWRIARGLLESLAEDAGSPGFLIEGCNFPIILRPIDSHAGRDLARIADPAELSAYLARVADDEFFISEFIDYRSPDGLFRKFRVALIDGVPYACHMAVSDHWMVHYVNAGMYEEAAKRLEEQSFMDNFAAFSLQHQAALSAIHQRTGLDYLCLDCAEMPNGELLIFEIDHAMVVHAMDSLELFPYKQHHMHKVKAAFRDFLLRRQAEGVSPQ
jgi:glutathione synthase/RimK-type ligase-like ATP-grasp enzyme